MIGVTEVLVSPYGLAGADPPVDITCLIDDVTINHGRSDTSGQPAPSSATLNLTIGPGAPIPPLSVLDVGSWLTVTVTAGAVTFPRFVGRISDISVGWDDEGANTGDTAAAQIVAVGPLADYARIILPASPLVAELDGIRVQQLFVLAGLQITNSDPGIYRVYPADHAGRDCLQMVRNVADSAGGLVWETIDGDIRYADTWHRLGPTTPDRPIELDLDACDVLVTPTWSRSLMGLVNDVTMTWGSAELGTPGIIPGIGLNGVYAASDPVSIGKYGRYAYATTVELDDESFAASVTAGILEANATPVWVVASLPVDGPGLDLADTQALLSLDVHSYVHVSGFPATGTTPTELYVYVEGWREKLAWGVWEIELYVSDQARTAGPTAAADVASDVASAPNRVSV